MKVSAYNFDIVVITLSLLALTVSGEQTDYCEYIHYDEPDVSNKPEFVIKAKFRIKTPKPRNEPDVNAIFKFIFRLCHIGKTDNSKMGKQLTSFGPRSHTHKQYSNTLDPRNKENPSHNEEDFGIVQYDPLEHSVYELNDGRNLFKISLNDTQQSTVYDLSKHLSGRISNSFALDWNTKNLYVIVNGYLKLLNLNDASKYLSNLSYMFFIHKYENLQIFPNQGYLVGRNETHITRFDMDGSKPVTLHRTKGYRIKEMALDYHEKNIYFTESHYGKERRSEICYVNLKGGKVKKFVTKNGPNVNYLRWKHLAVDEFYVYRTYFEEDYEYIWKYLVRARKSTGIYDKDFKVFIKNGENCNLVSANFINMLVLDGAEIAKRKSENHPCESDNGGCEGVCIPIPGRYKKLSKKCVNKKFE